MKSLKINLPEEAKFSEVLIGSAWAFSAHVITAGLGFASSVVIARLYGAEVLGIVSVIHSFLLLATLLSALGIHTSILRMIPEHLVKYSGFSAFLLYRKAQYLVLGASLVTGAVLFLISDGLADRILRKPDLAPYFALAAPFVVFRSMMVLSTQAARGMSRIQLFAFLQVLPALFNLTLLLLLTLFIGSQDVPIYALLGGVALTAMAGFGLLESLFSKTRFQPQERAAPMPVRGILFISLPMLITGIMSFITEEAGVILLTMFRTQTEVGYYVVAVKLATLATILFLSINALAAPKFSELFYSGNVDTLLYLARKLAKLIFWVSAPLLAGFAIAGKPVLHILFGHDFLPAYPALVLLAAGQLIKSMSGSTEFFMNMTGNQTSFRNIMCFAASINVGSSILLIPPMGISGAALGAAVGLAFWNVTALLFVKAKFGKTIGYLPW